MMAKKYRMVRMPEDIYQRYRNIKMNMEKDIKFKTGKDIKMSMPKVFKVVVSRNYNEKPIQVDMGKLVNLARKRRDY